MPKKSEKIMLDNCDCGLTGGCKKCNPTSQPGQHFKFDWEGGLADVQWKFVEDENGKTRICPLCGTALGSLD